MTEPEPTPFERRLARHCSLPVMCALVELVVGIALLGVCLLHGVLNHVNMRFRLRPLDRNFAVHFPRIDRLFGTHHLPRGEWPEQLGTAGHPVPAGFAAQLGRPFRLA